jgi:hypothetical protein
MTIWRAIAMTEKNTKNKNFKQANKAQIATNKEERA